MKKILAITILLSLVLSSCKKDKKSPEPEPAPTGSTYAIPTTYSFSVMDYTTSVQRITMLTEILNYIKTAHTTTASPALSGTQLQNMYTNINSQFSDPNLNTSGIQLKNKTDNTYYLQTDLDAALLNAGTITTPTTAMGSNGVAGKVISGTKAYIMDANGFEYKEIMEKGIMGGLFYYQAMTIMKNISTYDNTTIVTGQGTAQEHAWDEAFGYFGIPVAFPTNTVGLKNWGSYCNSANSAIGSNTTIMNAFLKGRAAISNKDNASRDQARNVVVATWEKIGAARFITYVKSAKANITDDAVRNHNLSEAVGFIRGFKYNPSKTISDAQIDQLLAYIGANLYSVTGTNLDNAINLMASIFALDPNTL
jgi:hypothetical protein